MEPLEQRLRNEAQVMIWIGYEKGDYYPDPDSGWIHRRLVPALEERMGLNSFESWERVGERYVRLNIHGNAGFWAVDGSGLTFEDAFMQAACELVTGQ